MIARTLSQTDFRQWRKTNEDFSRLDFYVRYICYAGLRQSPGDNSTATFLTRLGLKAEHRRRPRVPKQKHLIMSKDI
jgi:hypothetical protein